MIKLGKQVFKTSDDTELYVELHGDQNKPLIIWSHGFTGSARNWRSTLRQLPEYQHLIYDLRGHARSGSPDSVNAYSLSRFAQDLCELAYHFGSEKPVYLVGLSFGAMISFEASQQLIGLVKGQVLSSLPDPTIETSIAAKAQVFSEAILEQGLEVAGDMYVWGSRSGLSERDARLVKQGFLEHSALSLAYILQEAFVQLPTSEFMGAQLSQSSMPTLCLYGENDAGAKAYSTRVTQGLGSIEGLKATEIESGGHLLNLTSQQLFCQHLNVFLEAL